MSYIGSKIFTNLNTFLAEYPKINPDVKDYKFLCQAEQISRESTRGHHKVGCVIAQKGEVMGCGCNTTKTHPFQAKWNQFSSHLHAEMVALLEAMRNPCFEPEKATIYVSRYGRRGYLGCSYPCNSCWAALDYTGIRRIVCYDENDMPTKIEIRR
jgi:deoxycytidylate deaminase